MAAATITRTRIISLHGCKLVTGASRVLIPGDATSDPSGCLHPLHAFARGTVIGDVKRFGYFSRLVNTPRSRRS
jgi:hypothetical protein